MGRDSFVSAGMTDPFEARIGNVLAGKWTLVRLLGVGGMASVYEARHEIGRREAIKILHAEVARHEELRARFEQEAHAVNRLRHPNVVEIRDTGKTDDGCPFLVMELLDGETLADRLQRGNVDMQSALDLIDQLLDVLVVAHAEGIIHRDLKPDNLFILANGRLKVLDFGIARVRAGSAMKVVTRTGTSLGTPSYMPQEQIKGVDVDHRADLFAVGAIIWEIITGRDIHSSSSTEQLMVMMLTTPAPPLSSVAPQTPDMLTRVVDRALGFEPDDRYPDAATMREDLRAARAGNLPPFAAVPRQRTDALGTVARTPQAISRSQSDSAAHTTVPLPAEPVSRDAPAPDSRRSTRRVLGIVMIAGVSMGALATAALIVADCGETTVEEETAEAKADRRPREAASARSSSALRPDEPAPSSAPSDKPAAEPVGPAPAPSSSGSAPAPEPPPPTVPPEPPAPSSSVAPKPPPAVVPPAPEQPKPRPPPGQSGNKKKRKKRDDDDG